MQYVGRFAPSPTGPLHFGSLVAAVASYLDAKTHHGKWLVRMEDLDKPREMAGASDEILCTLEAFGFEWDTDVMYQSQRSAAYSKALAHLKQQSLIYPCTCSRKEIADSATRMGSEGKIYPKTCLTHTPRPDTKAAYRIITKDAPIRFIDQIQGNIEQNLAIDIGDFVLKRADGLFAYQLAVVVDDAEQGVTHVIRGADLLDSTTRQIYLQGCLGFDSPNYAHVPIATNAHREKLSKQTLAMALDKKKASAQLWLALDFLGQSPPPDLMHSNLITLWAWATERWSINKVTRQRSAIAPSEVLTGQ